MASSENPLRSWLLNLATALRSSVVLKQVPIIEQYRCGASSQSLRRCLAGISPDTGTARSEGGDRNGTGDTASTTQGLYSGIGTCEGKVVILRSEGEARPQVFLSCLECL